MEEADKKAHDWTDLSKDIPIGDSVGCRVGRVDNDIDQVSNDYLQGKVERRGVELLEASNNKDDKRIQQKCCWVAYDVEGDLYVAKCIGGGCGERERVAKIMTLLTSQI